MMSISNTKKVGVNSIWKGGWPPTPYANWRAVCVSASHPPLYAVCPRQIQISVG